MLTADTFVVVFIRHADAVLEDSLMLEMLWIFDGDVSIVLVESRMIRPGNWRKFLTL